MKVKMKAGLKISDLYGEGLEILISEQGEVRAEFFDGNFIRALRKPRKEDAEKSTVPIPNENNAETEKEIARYLEEFLGQNKAS